MHKKKIYKSNENTIDIHDNSLLGEDDSDKSQSFSKNRHTYSKTRRYDNGKDHYTYVEKNSNRNKKTRLNGNTSEYHDNCSISDFSSSSSRQKKHGMTKTFNSQNTKSKRCSSISWSSSVSNSTGSSVSKRHRHDSKYHYAQCLSEESNRNSLNPQNFITCEKSQLKRIVKDLVFEYLNEYSTHYINSIMSHYKFQYMLLDLIKTELDKIKDSSNTDKDLSNLTKVNNTTSYTSSYIKMSETSLPTPKIYNLDEILAENEQKIKVEQERLAAEKIKYNEERLLELEKIYQIKKKKKKNITSDTESKLYENDAKKKKFVLKIAKTNI